MDNLVTVEAVTGESAEEKASASKEAVTEASPQLIFKKDCAFLISMALLYGQFGYCRGCNWREH